MTTAESSHAIGPSSVPSTVRSSDEWTSPVTAIDFPSVLMHALSQRTAAAPSSSDDLLLGFAIDSQGEAEARAAFLTIPRRDLAAVRDDEVAGNRQAQPG